MSHYKKKIVDKEDTINIDTTNKNFFTPDGKNLSEAGFKELINRAKTGTKFITASGIPNVVDAAKNVFDKITGASDEDLKDLNKFIDFDKFKIHNIENSRMIDNIEIVENNISNMDSEFKVAKIITLDKNLRNKDDIEIIKNIIKTIKSIHNFIIINN